MSSGHAMNLTNGKHAFILARSRREHMNPTKCRFLHILRLTCKDLSSSLDPFSPVFLLMPYFCAIPSRNFSLLDSTLSRFFSFSFRYAAIAFSLIGKFYLFYAESLRLLSSPFNTFFMTSS